MRTLAAAALIIAGACISVVNPPAPPHHVGGSGQKRAPWTGNITQMTLQNSAFRRVLYTGEATQLVAMNLRPGENIGEETHPHVEQLVFCVSGTGRVMLDGQPYDFNPGGVVVIPAGTRHDVQNVGQEALQLYTVYSPPNHIDQRVHQTKADAQADHQDEAYEYKGP